MEIIAVTAPSNKGKTSCINLAAQYFYQQALNMNFVPTIISGNLSGQNNQDQEIIIEIPTCKLRVAFTSAGDSEECVKNNIANANSYHCHILVTATRRKGGPIEPIINECKNNNATVVWLQPAVIDWGQPAPLSIPQLHDLSAEYILETIRVLVRNRGSQCKNIPSLPSYRGVYVK